MLARLRTAWRAIMDPLITDRRYDVACVLTWGFYFGWGLFTALGDLSVFRTYERFEVLYPQIWGASVGLAAGAAAVAGIWTFLVWAHEVSRRIRAKRIEMISLCCVIGLIAVYPITIALTGDAQGNPRFDILSLSGSFFPLMIFRVIHLRARIQQLYRIQLGG